MSWRLDISQDNMEVRLDLQEVVNSKNITYQAIIAALAEKNIPVDESVQKRINELIEQVISGDITDTQPVIIKAQLPTPGRDGFFLWEEKFDPEKRSAAVETPEDGQETDYYNRSGVIIAYQGETLGVLQVASLGEAGKNIFGKTVLPEPGEEFPLEAGPNVQVFPDGVTFVALCDGEPVLDGTTLSIDPLLRIKSDVDFATGNIQFSQDIHIKGDIKDLFEVKAGGSITVDGIIEAALVECGGSLTVKRGIAGKEKGTVNVRQNISAKYLSNVTIWVEGNVQVDSEIVNANLNSRGKITLTKGAIHGGQVTAAGPIETHNLGSPAGVRTIIRSGIDPYIERTMNKLSEQRQRYSKRINELMPQAKVLLQVGGGQPNEKLTRMAEEIRSCKQQLKEIEEELQQLEQEMAETCHGIIRVQKIIYPGTIISIGSLMETVDKEMTGPLEVVVARERNIPVLAFRTLVAAK